MTGRRAPAPTLAFVAGALLALGLAQTTTSEVTSTTSSNSADPQRASTAPFMTATAGMSTSTSASVSGEPRVHLVKAGAGGFQFEPAELTNVSVGDIITFEFYPPDHSVAQAEYGNPCVPYEYTGKNKVGFWSQTQWVETASDITHWNLTINSTEPIFYYCAAPDSCKGKLMVGAINPNSTQTLDAQIRAAKNADLQVAPGEAVPKEASSTLSAPSVTGSQEVSTPANRHLAGLSSAAIVGIVFGGIAFIAICAGMLFYLARRTRVRHKDVPVTPQPTDANPISPKYPPPFSPFPATSSFDFPYREHTRGYAAAGPPLDTQGPAAELKG